MWILVRKTPRVKKRGVRDGDECDSDSVERDAGCVPIHGLLKSSGVSKVFYHMWRAQSAAYVVRSTLRTLRELDRRRGVVLEGRGIEPGSVSVHVRHGDKWKEEELADDATFLRSAEAIVERDSKGLLQRRILLSTQEPNTVRFFSNLSDWKVKYTNYVTRDAFKDPTMSPEGIAARIGWDEEFLNSLLSFQLALECEGFVGDHLELEPSHR